MAFTYEPIATNTVSGSSTTTVTFSSIPSTYTDLVLIINGSSSTTTGLPIVFNSDTATNYSRTLLYGTGTAAGSQRSSNTSGAGVGYLLTTQTVNRFYIFNYANTTTFKTVLTRSDGAGDSAQVGVGLWRSTAAINSITFNISSYTFNSGTMFTLYGIKAA